MTPGDRPFLQCPPSLPDVECSHIVVAGDGAGTGALGPLLVRVCPAGVYSVGRDGAIAADYARCLECGACGAVAGSAVTWRYPRGGFGIAYRHG